jgi:hypothetical protein
MKHSKPKKPIDDSQDQAGAIPEINHKPKIASNNTPAE